jgi:hypothetical protein
MLPVAARGSCSALRSIQAVDNPVMQKQFLRQAWSHADIVAKTTACTQRFASQCIDAVFFTHFAHVRRGMSSIHKWPNIAWFEAGNHAQTPSAGIVIVSGEFRPGG